MAVDEANLEAAAEPKSARSNRLCLRLYRWSEPTLSLGYFQPYQQRNSHAHSADYPVVRRASGGGAIVHDRELTYSLVVPPGHPLARRPLRLYTRIHETLVRALRALRIETRVCGESGTTSPSPIQRSSPPFLCFQRRSPFDLVQDDPRRGDRKIVGSAQRRRRGAVLQQGSILLATSVAAPQIPGPESDGPAVETDALITHWWGELAREFNWAAEPVALGEREQLRAGCLVAQKYGHDSWTRRR